MAIPKAINKKSYYGSEGAGDIAMPPLDQTPPIQQAAPDPWATQQSQSAQNNPFGAVPDELPQEEMQSEQEPEESTRDEMSQVEESVGDELSPTEPPSKPSPKESFRLVREAKERAERERDAMLSQMLAMQQQMQLQQQQQGEKHQNQSEPLEDYDFDIESDALAEGKHLKKLMAKQKAMEQQLKRYQAQSEEVAIETRIRTEFPDFDKVVSKENVDILVAQFPQIAETLRNTPNMYNKAATAYTVIKNFGIHKDTPKFEADRAKAVSNAQKPRPLASVNPTQGDSPLSKANAFANGMTDELKEQLRREMYNARKSL